MIQSMQDKNAAVEALRNISPQDFQVFGSGHIGYIRPAVSEGRKVYALYAADGRLLTLQDMPDVAALAARQNGIEPLSVH